VSDLSGSVQIRQHRLERMFAAAAFLAPKYAINVAGLLLVVSEQPDLVTVDHLWLLKDKDQWRSEVKRQGHITQRLKDIAKEFNCHMMVLAQLNRALENRTDKSPTLYPQIQ